MGASGQGIDVGDAVLHFLGDTTHLDEAFTRVPAAAEASMGKAARSVAQVGDAVDQVTDQMAVGQNGAVKLGEITTLAGTKARESMYQARGELGLLGEMFGVHLPRHVRSFVAELPGVGAAMSAAFSATAILFLIEALVKGIERIQAWAEHAHKVALAWDEFNTVVAGSFAGLDNKLLEAGIKLDELKNDHVDALKKELELIDHISMKELEQQFGILAKAADAMFAQLKASWFEQGEGSKGAKNALEEFKAQYDLLLAEGKKKEASDLLAGTAHSAQVALDKLTAAKKAAEELNAENAKLAAENPEAGPVPLAAGPTETELGAQEVLVKALNAQLEAETKINELAKDNAQLKTAEEGKKLAGEQAAAAKLGLDAQLEAIKKWRSAQHIAFEAQKIDLTAWLVAERQATDAAAIAHEAYQQRLVAIYSQAGETLKAQTAQQELATLKVKDAREAEDTLAEAMKKHHAATLKIVEEYGKLISAGVDKNFLATQKAAEQLTRAEEELAKAQDKLAQDKLAQHFKDQETAIARLAQMHLISEGQKNERLKALEQEQATAAIAILNDQLARERALVDAAQAKVEAARSNPFFTPAQVLELEAQLAKAKVAIVNTQAQIVQTEEKFNKESEALDKSRYGKALLLAQSFGRELLAEQLRQNHAELQAAQQQLILAKDRGEDTKAIQAKIVALKQHEVALEKEAAGNKTLIAGELALHQAQLLAAKSMLAEAKARDLDTTAINKQIAALQKLIAEEKLEVAQTKQTGQEIDKLKATTQAAAATMLSSISNAMQGIITGQQSFGAAMEAATFKMIGSMAQSWAEYFSAKGIADVFWDPTLGAAELAAAAALYAVSGVMSGLASNVGSGSHAAPGSGPISTTGGARTVAATNGPQTVNVTHLAAGGIVRSPTLFVAGDSASGGRAEEAIIPLDDPVALARIANALMSSPTLRAASRAATASAASAASAAPPSQFDETNIEKFMDHLGMHLDANGGGDTHIHVNVKGSVDHGTLAGLVQKINRKVRNNTLHLKTSDTLRITRRSQ